MNVKPKHLLAALCCIVMVWYIIRVLVYVDYLYSYNYRYMKLKIFGVQSYCPSEPMLHTESMQATRTSDMTWNHVVSEFVSSNHAGYAIYAPDRNAGLCNRMLNSISVLMFAMATNRSFWLNWTRVDTHAHYNEVIGQSEFSSLFQTRLLSKPPPAWANTLDLNVDECLAFKMRYGDVRQIKNDVVSLNSGDFWGSILLLNPIFKESTFKNLNMNEGFPVLFKHLFNPHVHSRPKRCSWFFQYRYNWAKEYSTAPFDNFLGCATTYGFTKEHYSTSYVITDNLTALMQGASLPTKKILTKMNFIEKKTPCRGPCGDNSTVAHMYALSSCQHAVLTASSSFGVCIAGLGNIQNVVKVSRYGDCHRPKYLLLDPNAMAPYGSGRTLLHEI